MKKTLLFSAAFFATIAASAQTIVWPSTVNRETKEANLSATVTGSETITATDITLGADIKIGDKDGANAVTAVKNTTGENLQFPSETEGMISWRPINGNVDDAEATADLAEGAGAYIDFTIEEGDINKTFAGMSSFEFDVTKVGTDATRINVKLIGEGDTNVDTGWLINADNAKSFGDEYQADYDAEAKNKDYPWDEAANGYNPSRNDGSKGVSGGANANGISHVKLAVPAEFAASNPYKVTLRIAIIKCANNKDLAVNAVTFNFGDSTTPVEEEPEVGPAIIAEVDWTQKSEWDGGWYSTDYAEVSVEQGTGLIINCTSDGTTNYWEPQVPMIGGIAEIAEGGQYQVKFQFTSPVAGELRLDFYSWAEGESASMAQVFEVAEGDNDLTIDFLDYPTGTHNAGIFYQCGKLPGKHIIKKVEVWDLEADPSAIKTVKTAKKFNGAMYNLAGQKVNASYKGVVIKDGKKYIQK